MNVPREATRTPLPRALFPLTIPLSWMYANAVARRNRRFDHGRGVQTIDRPVISVGNISTGGTGKTPMVAWIARRLIEARLEPLIAMRGYRARPGELSDEQAEYLQMLPEAHVVANPNRAMAIQAFLPAHPDVRAVILDDGFQHRQIKRDLDLVLIDATAGTFEDRLLPAGNLREPLESLRRADAVIVTHADFSHDAAAVPGRTRNSQTAGTEARSTEDLNAQISDLQFHISDLKLQISDSKSQISDLKFQIERYHGKPPLAITRHVWTRLDVYCNDGVRISREIDWLRGKRIVTMLGIGNPRSMLLQLQSVGAEIIKDVRVADHQSFDSDSLSQIEWVMETEDDSAGKAYQCDALVVTQKDWVKLEKVIDWKRFSLPIVAPRLAIEFIEGEAALLDLLMKRVAPPIERKPLH